MIKLFLTGLALLASISSGCNQEPIVYQNNAIKIAVEPGEEWLHNFPLFMGIKIKNAPQIAIWAEDMEGNYLSTIYVTNRIARQSWRQSGGNRRKEALPHWSYSRGVQYEDGLYLPTKKQPLTDGTSGATPRGSFDATFRPDATIRKYRIKIEVNHSTDFNAFYTPEIPEGAPYYSGGASGSGQPALVYYADIDLDGEIKQVKASLLGHSSPDGTSGEVSKDLSTLTSALHIIKHITVELP